MRKILQGVGVTLMIVLRKNVSRGDQKSKVSLEKITSGGNNNSEFLTLFNHTIFKSKGETENTS
jgi:hypothetical protein